MEWITGSREPTTKYDLLVLQATIVGSSLAIVRAITSALAPENTSEQEGAKLLERTEKFIESCQQSVLQEYARQHHSH